MTGPSVAFARWLGEATHRLVRSVCGLGDLLLVDRPAGPFLAMNEPQRAATMSEQALALLRGPPFPALADWDRARSEGPGWVLESAQHG